MIKYKTNLNCNLNEFHNWNITGWLCPILRRFWDMATYWLKIAYFPIPLLFGAPLPMFPLEFRGEVNREETRDMGLLVMNVAWS